MSWQVQTVASLKSVTYSKVGQFLLHLCGKEEVKRDDQAPGVGGIR